MARLVIEFDWVRDPKGYRLVENKRELRVVRNGKGHSPNEFSHYRPLAVDSLFLIFAKTVTKPGGVLDFVERFGPLTLDGWTTNGDDVNLALLHAEHMRQVLNCWTDKKRPNLPLGQPPSTYLNAMVLWDPVTKAPKWELRPNSLLDALWLQLAQGLTSNIQMRHCEHCGDWFEAGRGTGRRADSKFCSDEHRIAFNSRKRSKEK
jgi:hypothetical protein